MSDIRNLMEAIEDIAEGSEMIEMHDSFSFELGDDVLVETGVVAVGPEAIIVEADQKTLDILSEHFILEDFQELTEGDVIPFRKPKGDLYTQFINSYGAASSAPRQQWLQAAMLFLAGHPDFKDKSLDKVKAEAMSMYDQHLQQPMDESNSILKRIKQYAGLEGPNPVPQDDRYAGLEEPTIHRIERGTARRADKTDYNVPAFLRKADRTGKKLSPGLDKLIDPKIDESKYPHVSMRMGSDSDASSSGSFLYEGYKIELDKTTKIPQEDEEDVVRKDYVIKKDNKKVGLLTHFSPGGEISGKLHGKALPDISNYSGQSVDAKLHRFLKSTTGKKWASNLKHKKEEPEQVEEAKYHGRNVPLGKPMKGDVKKSKVYVRKPNGKIVKVNFGDKNMRIKKNSPSHRKSFRARHHCENPGPRWKARYWSCRAW